ncbi:unnamed protein product [Gadus morhua 'NCC']
MKIKHAIILLNVSSCLQSFVLCFSFPFFSFSCSLFRGSWPVHPSEARIAFMSVEVKRRQGGREPDPNLPSASLLFCSLHTDTLTHTTHQNTPHTDTHHTSTHTLTNTNTHHTSKHTDTHHKPTHTT